MKAKAFFIGFLVVFTTNFVSSQSLESQLKIIFGDALTTFGKNDFTRFVGKSLTTSGNMDYNMELIKAQNNQTLNINLPPNTYLGPNNQVMPNQGYQWANPSNPSDYSVTSAPARGKATLPSQNLDYLRKNFIRKPQTQNHVSTLNTLFTYNWLSDFNGDNKVQFTEFNNIKRTFYMGEPMCYTFSFLVRSGTKNKNKEMGDAISFLIQVFDATTGKVIAKRTYDYHENAGFLRMENRIYSESLGNYLPAGRYMIAVSITSLSRPKGRYIQVLREYFEVIE